MSAKTKRAAPLARRLAASYLREVMGETIKGAQQALELIQQVVKREDPPLWRALVHDGMGPQFALSWVLTWFAHDLSSLPQVIFFVIFFFPFWFLRELSSLRKVVRIYELAKIYVVARRRRSIHDTIEGPRIYDFLLTAHRQH
jgi:hypothetical protein